MRMVMWLIQERMALLPDFFTNGRYFWRDPEEYDSDGIAKRWKPGIPELLGDLLPLLEDAEFRPETLETLIRETAERKGLGAGKVIHPLRLALTGATASPSLFDMMAVLGRETCLRRLRRALEQIPVPEA